MKTLSVISVLLLLTACTQQEQAQVQQPRAVHIEKIQLSSQGRQHEYSGEIVPRYESSLAFQVAGKITKRLVDTGDKVKKGQPLATLDSKDYDLRVQQAEAKLNVAKANYQRSQSEMTRYNKLLSEKLISQSQYEQHLNQDKVASAQQQEAKTALNIAQNQRRYTVLKASQNGVITHIQAEEGQVLAAGQVIIRLARPEHKEVAIELPESELENIKNSSITKIKLWALPDVSVQGNIREISPSADPKTRTYATRISIDNANQQIQMGMTASVIINSNNKSPIVQLPLSALLKTGEDFFVWSVDSDTNKLLKNPVVLGKINNDKVIISGGLNDGQQVVIAGVHMLHENQEVRIYQSLDGL